jgi:signal transduction histidine kinase
MATHEHHWLALASSVAHDLRTPLSALAGEVDLALRRERPAAAYREALTRIGASVRELMDLANDLSLLSEMEDENGSMSQTTRLDVALAQLADRFPDGNTSLHFETTADEVSVFGNELLIVRALTLLIEHAIRHRRTRHPIRIRVKPCDHDSGEDVRVLILDGEPPAFSPDTWQHLNSAATEEARANAPGLLALQTAAHIVRKCGGDLTVRVNGERASVHALFRAAVDR